MEAVGHMQKIRHICWRLITQSTHRGQETDHADSTALKWGTWFISCQSRTVMPNTGLNSELVQIYQFWLKMLNKKHWNQVRKNSCAEWVFTRCMYCMHFKSVTSTFYCMWFGATGVENMIKAITSYSGSNATGSVKVQQLPPATQHILLLCTYRHRHPHTHIRRGINNTCSSFFSL